ncbi:MAG: PEPxxWA-CTERM sorting domain-containing protein [Hyphomicrobiales bacterium]|nr:PEPxxWA-CTERM sorting domain-containing protein [Hyphomicrobiales bacterium]MBV9909157.1 PEPxxWA-CTERM sorting domain-containing protein [Hyphomicrobiales bacterium]
MIFNTGGVVVTLNQQIPDTTETQGVTTNAIAINLVDFHVGSNVVNGAIDIDQSAASLAVIPEPATWVEMLVGFGVVGLLVRGRTGSAAAAKT